MTLLKLRLIESYGRLRIYPLCEMSAFLIQLIGHKTFTEKQVRILEKIGYKIEWEHQLIKNTG